MLVHHVFHYPEHIVTCAMAGVELCFWIFCFQPLSQGFYFIIRLLSVEKIGFEGGQMPLQRRVPKSGFKNINHKEYFAINLSTLQKLAEQKNLTKIGIADFVAAGLTNGKELVKILGNGELKAKIDVEANAFSKTAEEAIKAVGGNATII